uniref:Uncharacterized protein n=1 Tax=Arundo donax TaxID=35708 RepID=A0A0A9FSB9_ARUDO
MIYLNTINNCPYQPKVAHSSTIL